MSTSSVNIGVRGAPAKPSQVLQGGGGGHLKYAKADGSDIEKRSCPLRDKH